MRVRKYKGFTMKDKLLRGVIAGVAAGLIKDLPPVIFHITKHEFSPTYWDYAGKIGFGRIPHTGWEIAYAIILQICFSIGISVAMVYLLPKIKSSLWYVKGAAFGFGVWFFIRITVTLFALKEFTQPQIFVSIINVSTSVVYGVLVAFLDRYLENLHSRE